MNAKQIGLGIVLVDFLGLCAYAVYLYGYVGFFDLVTANAATVAAFVDLVIALALVTVWMWRDARERGISPIPYTLITLALGSAGPLLYLIRRAGGEARRAVETRSTALAAAGSR